MAQVFADTTVLVEIAERTKQSGKVEDYIRKNQPAEVPEYALKEYLAGRIQIVCDAHNRLLAANSVPEAIASIAQIGGFAARTSLGKIQELAHVMDHVMKGTGAYTKDDAKRESLQYLALKAATFWARARKPKSLNYVQNLNCLKRAELRIDDAGAIRGPANSFSCERDERCGAADYLSSKASDVSQLVKALRPKSLDEAANAKQETGSRRKALKELLTRGRGEFNKSRCRGLGDAYFAVMCPPGAHVLTTNLSDHELLCETLKKKARSPLT